RLPATSQIARCGGIVPAGHGLHRDWRHVSRQLHSNLSNPGDVLCDGKAWRCEARIRTRAQLAPNTWRGETGRIFMRTTRRVLMPLTVLFVAGCAVGPNYKRPAVDSPANFRFATSRTTDSFGDLPWWEVFKDPTLQDLLRAALTNNYDLKRAVARVEQAR